jgi:phosphoribosylformimino-5-aminoimidazole carboxamide ribotide isomerase
VSDPDAAERLTKAYPGRVAIGLDHRDFKIAVRGWQEVSDVSVEDLIVRFTNAGAAAFVMTDVTRDGLLTGPDLEGLTRALTVTQVPLIASGGVACLDDIRALRMLDVNGRGVAGVITGRAIYENKFSVAEAVAACG